MNKLRCTAILALGLTAGLTAGCSSGSTSPAATPKPVAHVVAAPKLAAHVVQAPSSSPATPTGAHHAFDKMAKKYAADIAELTASFAGMSGGSPKDPWLAEVDAACHPDPSGDGFGMMLVAPVLAKHGHTWPEFRADWKGIDAQIVAERLCK